MKKWIKWLIIIGAILIGTIFFGSIVLSLAGYMFDFLATLMDWLAIASRWLAKVLDIFGFTGIFSANASEQIIIMSEIIRNTKIGGMYG